MLHFSDIISNKSLEKILKCSTYALEIVLHIGNAIGKDVRRISDVIFEVLDKSGRCSIKMITIRKCSIDNDTVKELASCLGYVEEVVLSGNKLTAVHMKHISDGILAVVSKDGCCNVKKLILRDCSIDTNAMKELALCLHHIEEVDLSENELTYDHIKHVSDGIAAALANGESCSIKNVIVEKCLIDSAGMKELARWFLYVQCVDFSGNKLTFSHTKHISAGIFAAVTEKGRCNVKSVTIQKCSLENDGLKELARCLQHVETLDFSYNELTSVHLQHFSDGILAPLANGVSCNIKKLVLTHCSIDAVGMKELSRCIPYTEVLDLSGNKLTVSHIRDMADRIIAVEATGKKCNVKKITLQYCSIDNDNVKQLAGCLYHIEEVDLSYNKLTARHIKEGFVGIIRTWSKVRNIHIKQLNLWYCSLDIDSFKIFLKCLHHVEQVDLSGTKLTCRHVKHLSDGILAVMANYGCSFVRSLNLQCCSIDVGGMKELARCLHLVEEVNLSKNELTGSHLRQLSDGLCDLVANGATFNVKKLIFWNCSIDIDGMKELARCIHYIEEVDFSGNKLTVDHMKIFSDGILAAMAVGGKCKVKRVNLQYCFIDADGMKELARCIYLIDEIDFSGNRLTFSHMKQISDGILASVVMGGVCNITFRNCSIDVDGMKELARCIHHLQEIDLSGNKLLCKHISYISDDISTVLANGGSCTVKNLILRYCSLDIDCLKELEGLLYHVEGVDLSGNILTLNHMKHISNGILAAAANGFNVKNLVLSDCSIDIDGIEELSKCIHHLEGIDLSGNKLTMVHIKHISDGIVAAVTVGHICSIQLLNLCFCSIDVDGMKELARCLHHIKEIQLFCNKLSPSHMNYISDGVCDAVAAGNCSVEKLCLRLNYCSINIGGMKALAACMQHMAEIDLSLNIFTSSHMELLCDGILEVMANGERCSIKNLCFRDCTIDGLKELARCMYLIEEVNISSTRLTDSDMKHFSDAILAGVASGRGFNIKKINLADCSLSIDAMEELARCLPFLEDVNLNHNKLSVDHIMLISDGILAVVASGRSCNLKKLTLQYCSLDFHGIKELLRILEHVEEVDLSGNTLTRRHMQHICAHILACLDNKLNINFPNCSIDVEGMRELARCMHHVEEVNLSGNTLLVGHIKHISNAILTAAANGKTTMKKLNISACSIGTDGMKELARSIHLMEELDLSDNKLTVTHINHFSTEILSAIANGGSCYLKKVNLTNCLINVAGIKEITRYLHLLEEVNLSGNKLTINHVRHISDGILRAVSNGGSFHLRKINLTNCSIDVGGMKELARSLHLVEEVDLSGNKLTVNHVRHISDGILAVLSNGGSFDLRKVNLRNCSIDYCWH